MVYNNGILLFHSSGINNQNHRVCRAMLFLKSPALNPSLSLLVSGGAAILDIL